MNHLYLRRRSKLLIRPGSGGATTEQLATVQKEVERLGFVLTDEVIERLRTLNAESLGRFLRGLLKDLRQLTGAHRVHEPLYPGFPEQVVQLSEAELYLNALSHYVTLRRMPADEAAPERQPLRGGQLLRVVELGHIDDFEAICTRLAGAATSLSPEDRNDLEWFMRQYRGEVFRLLPAKFTFRENLALVATQLVRLVDDERTPTFLDTHLRTATDVLRLAVGLCGGDLSLAESTRFTALPRRHRKLLLGLLDRCENAAEDMLRWRERWKRLGERLHPGEYAEVFPNAAAAFDVVRNRLPLVTFNGVVEQALHAGDLDRAVQALESRPGEYARRLDLLLRTGKEPHALLQRFAAVSPRVSTPVLLQVLAHFQGRQTSGRLRVFQPKGDVAKLFAQPDGRAAIAPALARDVVAVCEDTLVARFASLPPLGRCHVDPALANHMVPMAQRSASKARRTLTRGSRVPMPEGGFVRLFLWWKNGRARTDVDLSAALFNGTYGYVDTIAFYNLRGWGAYHSGDITDAPKGAAEFIDLDIQQLRARGVRFVVMSLNSYSGQPYCDLPECFAGWMSRRRLDSGEPFEPPTVVDRVDLAADTQISLPLVLDLDTREVLWADIALREHPRFHNSVAGNLGGVSLMLRALREMVKPDLRTLFELHVRARGERVDDVAAAGTVFGTGKGATVSPFDADLIRAEYLA